MTRKTAAVAGALLSAVALLGRGAWLRAQGGDGPASPEVHPDGRITLRLLAPSARTVTISGDWGVTRRFETTSLTRDERGVWSATIGPSLPIVMRYTFTVDGVTMPDPRNERVLASAGTIHSLIVTPSAAEEFAAEKAVPHGAVRAITYQSATLGIARRAHVYTPPGYDRGGDSLPVLYLFPGAGGDDVVWSQLGRAAFVLDNLIASGRAKPMLAVMPDPRVPGQLSTILPTTPSEDRFSGDFLHDLVPFVARTFRVRSRAASTAIAGLSTGGAKAFLIGINDLDKFSQIGMFSSGWNPPDLVRVEEQQRRILDDPGLSTKLTLLWIGVGTEDSSAAYPNTPHLLAMLDRHRIARRYRETGGDHTWINWRLYLNEFAPLLFR